MITQTDVVFLTHPIASPGIAPSRESLSGATKNIAGFSRLLQRFEPISLSQMDSVALLDRTDTKYVLSADQLYLVLSSLARYYQVLDIKGIRLNRYQTVYFDTADFDLYQCHHARRKNRYKVRTRKYVDTNLSFLEVKLKTNKNRTVKQRIQTPALLTCFPPEADNFISDHCPFNAQSLQPKLWNNFSRITLVSKYYQERLTLDLNLQFYVDGRLAVLPGVAIAEVKQDGINRNSAFIQQTRANNIHPTGFSKYCVGVSMLYPDVKHNNFKPNLQLVNKIMQGAPYVQ